MTSKRSSVAIVLLADQVAAVCTIDRIEPAPWVLHLPARHPDRLLVEAKCLVARAYLTGDVDGAYDDRECEAAARLLLDEQPPPVPVSPRGRRRFRRAL